MAALNRTEFAWPKTIFGWLAGLALATGLAQLHAAAKSEPGLMVTYTSLEDKTTLADVTMASGVCLYVEKGRSPSPFVAGGRFSARWEGTLSAELRSEFFFQAELNGSLKMDINGATAFETTGTGGASPLSKAIQLKKGANPVKVTFTSPPAGDALVRLSWTEKGTNTSPIPLSVLNHAMTPELQQAAQLYLGRELFLEHRCAKCHIEKSAGELVPEASSDAPSFEGIGARRNYEWMVRWIHDPKALRPTAHMPRIFSGAKARESAEAVAAFLASLTSEVSLPEPKGEAGASAPKEAEQNEERQSLFEKFHCVGCHNAPDAKEVDPKKISLTHVGEKFARGKLVEFLRKPEAHYAWIRMPNFKLSASEAEELSAYLLKSAAQPKETSAPAEPGILDRGRKLVQSSGCLNCHQLKLDNEYSAPKLAERTASQRREGCLAAEAKPDSRAPQFSFSAGERETLLAFVATGRASLGRHVPSEFAERQTRAFNCAGCHGQMEGFPSLEVLGGKLKPEWVAAFIGGDIPYKPRPEKHPRGETWLEARMPAFKSCATPLAQGLAAQHGFPPRTPPEPPIDAALARLGQKLVGKDGGFSCVSCHGIGSMEALEVFESEGINLAYSSERMLPAFYRRWLRNPASIDPQTKMPVYFDEGKSPLTEILDGDAEKQVEAIWQYLRLGNKMTAPGTSP